MMYPRFTGNRIYDAEGYRKFNIECEGKEAEEKSPAFLYNKKVLPGFGLYKLINAVLQQF